jgi:hypothetical protein
MLFLMSDVISTTRMKGMNSFFPSKPCYGHNLAVIYILSYLCLDICHEAGRADKMQFYPIYLPGHLPFTLPSAMVRAA